MLYISNEEITKLLQHDLPGTVETMGEMFAALERGDFSLGGGGYSHGMRMQYPVEGGENLFIAMPGYLGAPFHVTGVKWHGPNRRCEGAAADSHFMMILNDHKTGIPKACMPVGLTTLYRTAAMSILAAEYLANPDAETIGIIGPGKINTLVAEGLLAKFPNVSRIIVKGRGPDSTQNFVRVMENLNRNIKIEVVSSFEDAVKCADIVSINTGFEFAGIADMPIIRDGWIKPGAVFLCSAFVKFSDRLILEKAVNVCDLYDMYASYEQELGIPVYKQLSNLGNRYVDLIRDGKLRRETVFDMKEIVTDKVTARTSKEDIILFSSGGFATQDLAICEKLYQKALKEGVGTELPVDSSDKKYFQHIRMPINTKTEMQTNTLEWLEQQCRRTPDKIAFGDRTCSLTYAQTADNAKRLACGLHTDHRLRDSFYPGLQNSGQTGAVAIYMDKTVHTLCGMFGVVYAGGYYSNIDTQFPNERVIEILKSLKPAAIITDASHFQEADSQFSEYAPVLSYETLQESGIDEPWLEHVRSIHCDTNPLYCNFTSGSTGTPKGVLVSHRSVIDFISIFVEEFGIHEQDILANQAPLDFDVSVKDIYSGIAAGAKVQLIPREYFSTPVDLMDYLEDTEATILIWAVSAMCFVSTMRGFQYKVPRRIRQVMFSGEVMPMKQLRIWKKFLPESVYVNLYGPTEITCNCTYYKLNEEDFEKDNIPIGKPFRNEKVFLLDAEQKMVTDAGHPGEICVSGSCVAVGYLNRLDSMEFAQNPCNTSYYERIYKTGDLGYWREDGNLMYAGRKDFQIKHLGHRIELGEIERCCEAMPEESVTRSCCIYHKQRQRLLLFYEGTAQEGAVHETLADRLPHFMLPNNIVRISQMPMNKNGKIDRDRLLQIFLER